MCWVWESKDREESQCPHGSTVSSTSWEGDIWSCKSATRLINRMLLRLFCPDKGQTGQFIGGLLWEPMHVNPQPMERSHLTLTLTQN
jgi:hypothetical protein